MSRKSPRPRKRPHSAPNPRPVQFHFLVEEGWLHTHGMAALGLPELEARHFPAFLGESATRILRHICDYMIESGTPIRAGETMAISDRTRFRLIAPEPLRGNEVHYADARLLVADIEPICDCCRLRPSDRN
jgi:hypothetical protein